MERLTPREPPDHPHQGEASTCWRLTVRVLEARGLGWADVLSQADPYVVLQLPTAPGITFKTRTVANSSRPVWNETFSFLIQSQVKNVLELSVYDEDSVTEDDVCCTFLYDVSDVVPGSPLRKTFSLRPQGQEELDVEFLMEKTSDRPENLITNNVLVARELSRLDILLESTGNTAGGSDQDSLELELVLKGSYEDTQTLALGTTSVFCFHYMAAQEAELRGRLRSSKSKDWNSDISAGHLTMPLKSLTTGKKMIIDVPATNAPGMRLQLKAVDCPKELAVRLGFDLCVEEKAFLSRRKQVVAKALKKALQLDRDLQENEVPIVGVMATGGGARAMTSLYGHLLALKTLGLLDCVTYFSGISGATWTMAQLYGDPEWSQKDLEGPIRYAREHLAQSKLGAFSSERLASYRQELELRMEERRPTTFVDLWALVLESMLHNQVMDRKLSEQRAALTQGQNPLPLYLSLNVKENNLETSDFKEWVEFSPYEVGFLKYGAFVPSELFGSEFFMGQLMRRLPESRICFLEGIWSNIFSMNLLDVWYDLTSSGDAWKQHIEDRTRNPEEPPASSRTASGLEASWLQPGTALAQALKGVLTGRPLCQHSPNFLQGLQLHRDYRGREEFSAWADSQLDAIPGQLTPQEPRLCLVDAGYFLNTSAPSMFRPGRRLDLILSFDYSLSSPFETLQQTEAYCRGLGLPFPCVEPSPQDQRQPKECHLFSDPTCPKAPVLLHFPLVNASPKEHSAPGIQDGPTELRAGEVDLTGPNSPYSLFNMTYKEEDFDRLLQLSAHNVQNSQGAILQALKMALTHQDLAATLPGARS
ncbi:cytosolic phospholipase A2 delta [Pipistrellus kuhlii]|uniref:Phospholipase A2 n=1 Tax=Pipistrellus kuhlii TaxID=59472 RepID=A0A7J8B427_PIPKU|nr:cytosolic phospholipase A2 delta [Pipistrellus kuhlii]KAF6393259.1 phospholipase A2 group IVD [Pipistrellus kuhlii]